MKATVAPELCTGCGLCIDIAPEVFQMNDEGLAEAIVDEVPADQQDAAREAADDCPVEAITIDE